MMHDSIDVLDFGYSWIGSSAARWHDMFKNIHPQLEPKDTTETIARQVLTWFTTFPLLMFVASISSLLLVYSIWAICVQHNHLDEYPGPRIAAYTRLWLCKVLASGESANRFVDVNKKYGSIARIGPNNLMTDDPELVRRILTARSHYTRGPWFDSIRIDPEITNIVSERDKSKHNHLRHQMASGYAGKDIEGVEQIIGERLTEFIGWLDGKATAMNDVQRPIDLARPVQYLTVDTITHLCFGKPLGFVKENRDLFAFLETIETQLPIVQHFSVILELNWLLQKLVRLPYLKSVIAPSPNDTSGIGVIMGISRQVIDKRYAPGAETKRDMLGAFMRHGITADEAETEISISLVAGSDTTATSMRAILMMIISNPRVYRRLQNEIDDAAHRGELASPIADEQSRHMSYLQACIKEGLRRYPPITQLRERVSHPQGDVFNGKTIPGGTFVGINAWGLQLNPVFGEDTDTFRPERWLEAGPEQLLAMNRVHELIFGHGNTRCLGIPIAVMSLNKFIVELLRRYDISLADATRPWQSRCYGIFFQKDFNVLVTHRDIAV